MSVQISNGRSILDAWVGQKGESFPIGQPAKIVETFDFTREGEIYVTTGSSSGRNTYIRRGETLVHQKHGEKVTATLQPNGELAWSHGYGSRIRGGSVGGASGSKVKWSKHVNIDMCGQGDVEIIQNWRSTHSIDDLKKIVEAKGYSAVCVGSFGHAALKKFSFQLTPGHCKPSKGYTNELYIYHNAIASKPFDRNAIVGPDPKIAEIIGGIGKLHFTAAFPWTLANIIMTIVAFAAYDENKNRKCVDGCGDFTTCDASMDAIVEESDADAVCTANTAFYCLWIPAGLMLSWIFFQLSGICVTRKVQFIRLVSSYGCTWGFRIMLCVNLFNGFYGRHVGAGVVMMWWCLFCSLCGAYFHSADPKAERFSITILERPK